MKTINLYFDFEFTSLSPDAQPISLGIVSDIRDVRDYPLMTRPYKPDKKIEFIDQSLSFYAEFSDFDINRCDDWVKENVVSKLLYINNKEYREEIKACPEWNTFGNKIHIKMMVNKFLEQFSDYQITFICDCGTFDWYWMLQLLAEWDEKEIETDNDNVIYDWLYPLGITVAGFEECYGSFKNRTGLPKLPANISPVPQDLNDLIAFKKGISAREAFELDREELGLGYIPKFMSEVQYIGYKERRVFHESDSEFKHTSLWDAKVIKSIYEKLK